jgi:excisionase family DNA binding protein
MNKKQAASYCGVSTETLDRYKDQKKLGYVQIGKRCLFTQELLDEFILQCTKRAVIGTTPRENTAMAKAAGGVA